jgi:endoglucanase Acf2
VTGTKIEWKYTPENSTVTERFVFSTKTYEGKPGETLFALYPHQWRNTDHEMLGATYDSVRGTMKLARGNGFRTRHKFPGVLFALPDVGLSKPVLSKYLDQELAAAEPAQADTYWSGK